MWATTTHTIARGDATHIWKMVALQRVHELNRRSHGQRVYRDVGIGVDSIRRPVVAKDCSILLIVLREDIAPSIVVEQDNAQRLILRREGIYNRNLAERRHRTNRMILNTG